MTNSTKKQTTIKLNKDQTSIYNKIENNKSEQIRTLLKFGFKSAQVARKVGVIDQFVSNVKKNMKVNEINKKK